MNESQTTPDHITVEDFSELVTVFSTVEVYDPTSPLVGRLRKDVMDCYGERSAGTFTETTYSGEDAGIVFAALKFYVVKHANAEDNWREAHARQILEQLAEPVVPPAQVTKTMGHLSLIAS